MTGAIFVDTNVLVYARDASQAEKHVLASQWLARIWREQSGRTSAQVLSELYVTLTRKISSRLSSDDAWDEIEDLLAWDPLPIDRDVLLRARDIETRYRLAWWDCTIVAAAQLQDCELLLSEDLQDGMRFGPLTVRSPFELRANDVAATYVVTSGLAQRHRPRGRPRKPRPVTAA